MKKILILAEHKKGELKKTTLELLGASKGEDVTAIIFGADANAAAQALQQKGVKDVVWVNSPDYNHYHPMAFADTLEKLITETKPQYVLGSATSLGKDLIPRMAARFDAPLVSDCTELQINPALKTRRPFFSGKALATVELNAADLSFITVRPNSLAMGEVGAASGAVRELKPTYDFASSPIQFLGQSSAATDRPDLSEATVILSGGRSLKTKDNFKILFDMADVVGAAVGASRAAVDEGLAGHEMQVGQTGKTVNPSLYMAFGISGAIQHLAGMRTSKVIVAINKDVNAPLFQKANYGVVGDLFVLAPLITQEFKKLLGK